MKKIFTFILFFISNIVFSQTILFMAGIEKDVSSDGQANILRKALPHSNIIVYKRNQVTKIIQDSRKNSNCKIVLFSAACKNSYEIIISTTCDVWIIEPHFSSSKEIKKSLLIGFPKNQIILGPTKERGEGIIKGCHKTPKSYNHFQSLNYFATLLNK